LPYHIKTYSRPRPLTSLGPLTSSVWGGYHRPKGDSADYVTNFEDAVANDTSTAEIAANAPRYRRKSSTFIDGIHDIHDQDNMAPAQLYSTMSGRLFHSGRIAIVMVGLPARGKT